MNEKPLIPTIVCNSKPKFLDWFDRVDRDLMAASTFDLAKQFDKAFEEGLKRKGFEFDSDDELIEFVKERCSCVDEPYKYVKTYFVDGAPFLEYYYNSRLEINESFSVGNANLISISYGGFKFIPEQL